MSSPTRRQTSRFLKPRKHAHKGFFQHKEEESHTKTSAEYILVTETHLVKAPISCGSLVLVWKPVEIQYWLLVAGSLSLKKTERRWRGQLCPFAHFAAAPHVLQAGRFDV